MNSLVFLVPLALLLGGAALAAFLWSLGSGQYDDLDGAAERILLDENSDGVGPRPKEDAASDAAGTMDLWRIDVSGVSVSGEPRRLTFSGESDTEPAVGQDGSIYFVRGTSAAADLWKLKPGGGEERVTSEPGADRSPAASPDFTVNRIRMRSGAAKVVSRARHSSSESLGSPNT